MCVYVRSTTREETTNELDHDICVSYLRIYLYIYIYTIIISYYRPHIENYIYIYIVYDQGYILTNIEYLIHYLGVLVYPILYPIWVVHMLYPT